ncbi:MAG: hypothetical protein ABMA25_03285 [Ilumatobacteraceae bacterium]
MLHRSSPAHHRVARVLAATALLLAATGCSFFGKKEASHPIRSVAFIGDSLAEHTEPSLAPMVAPIPVIADFFGGTAPCDWLGKDLHTDTDTVAVITFIGNSQTPCMAAADGTYPHGQALLDRYGPDLTALVAQVRTTGARVLLVGQPARGDANAEIALEIDGINAILQGLAEQESVSFVDAGAAVEDVHGRFAASLPCLPGEASCGPDGTNIVRSNDGVHFCPGVGRPPCPEYSSGAFRFATAIAAALKNL